MWYSEKLDVLVVIVLVLPLMMEGGRPLIYVQWDEGLAMMFPHSHSSTMVVYEI